MYRLIVVDDDVDAVNSLSKNFPWEQSGFSLVGTFQDGESALEWLKEHTVDLILCDIKMPNMNGLELARRAHAMRRPEKIIFVSGYKDFEYARKALEYGVSNYCIKPVTFGEMRETIQKVLKELERTNGTHLSPPNTEFSEDAADSDNKRNISDVKIEQIKKYICRHYDAVKLQQLAVYMQMNTTYLSSFFKKKTGQKLFDYITEVRLNAALNILKTDSTKSINEVAEQVGYTNAISFSRSFKKQFGVSPTDVRRNFNCAETKP